MKKHTSLILVALFGAVSAYGQTTTATTIPVGYVTQGEAGGVLQNNTDYRLSVPLERTTAFAGTVSAVATNTITITGAAFTPSQWTTIPHYVKITSGAKAGFLAAIDSHDATSVTVTPQSGQSLTGVVSGDKLSIQEAWTIGNFFESITVPAGLEVDLFSGTVAGINVAVDQIFNYDGGWFDGNGDPADNTVIYPGESFIVRNATGSSVTGLVVIGQVPVSPYTVVLQNVDAGQPQDIPFGIFSPVAQTFTATNLTSVANAGDTILIYDLAATGLNLSNASSLDYDGSGWIDSVSGDYITEGTYEMAASGLGYVYRRIATGTDGVWTFTPSYAAGL